MAAAASNLQIATLRHCQLPSRKGFKPCGTTLGSCSKVSSWAKLSSCSNISSLPFFQRKFVSSSVKNERTVTKAMAEASDSKPSSGLSIDLKG